MDIRTIIAAVAAGLLGLTASAQPHNPLSWTLSTSRIDGGYEIRATGTFDKEGYHTFDLREYEFGPRGTTFTVTGEGIELLGGPEVLSTVNSAYDDVYMMEVGTCAGEVVIAQKVAAKSGTVANVEIEWQCCDEANCLPLAKYSETVVLKGGVPDIVVIAVGLLMIAAGLYMRSRNLKKRRAQR